MPSESSFGIQLSKHLRPMIPKRYFIETKRSLLYAISFDDEGHLVLGQDVERRPTRGRGTGFEQDLLIFEHSASGETSIVPRVAVELKFGGVTTHDAIVYSEKARRIRAIYPFIRYGLVLGGLSSVPARALRLGAEFDFIVALPTPVGQTSLIQVAKLLRMELRLSRRLTDILRGRRKIAVFHRSLRHTVST